MSSRDQLNQKRSTFTGAGTKQGWSFRVSSNPTLGDQFTIANQLFYMGATSGVAGFTGGGYYTINTAASAVSSVSAISAAINIAIPQYATAAWGTSAELTVLAVSAGQDLPSQVLVGAEFSFTAISAMTGGNLLPEGYNNFITSAGNTVYADSPADMTRLQAIYPPKKS